MAKSVQGHSVFQFPDDNNLWGGEGISKINRVQLSVLDSYKGKEESNASQSFLRTLISLFEQKQQKHEP